jgi:hypothetical protein
MNIYIDNELGQTNILITAPHGGSKKPISLPDRSYGKLYRDSYTKSLTLKLLDKFKYRPYSLISNIHRKKVDLNRDLKEGAQENIYSKNIWYYWNYMVSEYKCNILSKNNSGLYIDIHSHNNSHEFQLGYNLSESNYNKVLKGKNIKGSTLDSLNENLYEMMFGEYSIKNSLEKNGFSVFKPRFGEQYFNGGYNIETFSGDGLASIQIEVPISILKLYRYDIVDVLYESIRTFKDLFIT